MQEDVYEGKVVRHPVYERHQICLTVM